ncbi:MAG: hypothetical protein HYR64_00640 [Fimbriimonas ginsengisoli]|uniref:Uncharacterized protein n=1 Tax=Fimbriimonas ginsengisoli TaxID=1005039 RepID=A0A931LQR8_FIMGI|nr:hypothetical protein [Fimbriimonas ginsengisoli]
MDDKKKIAVIAILFAFLLGVGAFQFVRSSGQPAPVSPKVKATAAADTGDKPAAKNPLFAQDLQERDPFHPGTLPPLPGATPLTPAPTPQPPSFRRNVLDQIPPFRIDKSGSLPPAGAIAGLPNMGGFGYQLAGVILGDRSAAVFVDGQGSQRLVQLGAAIDGDSRLVGLEKGRATVNFRGQILKLSSGGNTRAN